MRRALFTILTTIIVIAGLLPTVAAQSGADVNLRVHQGVWDARDSMDGEYFLTVQFYTVGRCGFALC